MLSQMKTNDSDNLIISRPRGPALFDLVSDFAPAGDQPTAISELVAGISSGERDQVLLGVTGSGKTFTISDATKRSVHDIFKQGRRDCTFYMSFFEIYGG